MGLFDWFRRKQEAPPVVVEDWEERLFGPDTFRIPDNVPNLGITDEERPNEDQQRTAYRGILYRSLQLRADAIADAMRKLTVERQTGQGEFEAVEGTHPWVTLLRRPSTTHSTVLFWKWVSLSRDLSGSADLIVERGKRGFPIALHPVYPIYGEIRVIRDGMGGVQQYIFWRVDGQTFPLEPRDVIRLRHPNPIDPHETASLIQAAAYEIDINLYMRIYRRDQMKVGGITATILKSDQDLTKEQAERYALEFKKRYMGRERVGEVAVMGKGTEPVPFAVNPKDLEFMEGSKLNTTDILNIMGVPEGMISDDANRANAESSRLTFYQNTIQPEANLMAAELTYSFERAFGATPAVLEVRVPDLMPLDHEFELRKRTEYVRAGLRTINEVRTEEGYDEVEGGDVLLVPSGYTPLEQAVKPPEPVPTTLKPFAGKGKPGQEEEPEEEPMMEEEE
jgi:HK97 family phage portal protein